jgi:hypothetical protein
VAEIDTQLLLTATSTADRDSKFFNAPSGVVCVIRATDTTITGVYVKTSDVGTSVWAAIWTAPVTPTPVAIPLQDGFQTANGKAPVAVYNSVPNTWTLYGNIGLINGGNIPSNTLIATLPAAVALSTVQPYYEGNAPTSVAGSGNPTGTAKISIAASGNITAFIQSGTQAAWVGFDLITLPGA